MICPQLLLVMVFHYVNELGIKLDFFLPVLSYKLSHFCILIFQAHGIDHLVIPTRDYLFAPSFGDINRAVDFIHSA